MQTFLDYIETGMTDSLRARLGHERQALHAYQLDFTHPATGESTTLTAPLSADLLALWGSPISEATLRAASAC